MPARRTTVALTGLAVGLTGAVVAAPTPAVAKPGGGAVVISEVYGGGGSSNASTAFNRDYVEIYNPTAGTVDLSTMKLGYRNQAGTFNSNPIALTGSVAPGDTYTVAISPAGSAGAPIPAEKLDQQSTAITAGATDGTILLLPSATVPSQLPNGDLAGNAAVIDAVGYGTAVTREGSTGSPAPSITDSASRIDSATDTDVNGTDFDAVAPTPDEPQVAEPPAEPVEATIAEIQGDGAASELDGDPVITEGVVTASYPTGGLDGFFLQTPGADTTPGASDGVFVYTAGLAVPAVGESVEVEGDVDEFFGLTQVVAETVTAVADLGDVVANDVVPGSDCALGACLTGDDLDEAREEVEGEAFDLDGDFTVTDNYDGSPYFEEQTQNASGNFGEIGLAAESTEPLVSPTEVVNVGADATPDEVQDLADREDYNEAHRVVLDDGSSWNYALGGGHTDDPFPWMTAQHQVRVGAAVTFEAPVVLSWTFGNWKLTPPAQVVGVPEDVTIEQTRADEAAPRDVGGDVVLGTFNVLNFFPTTGRDFDPQGTRCDFFEDRDGNEITVDDCGTGGPRGAADGENLERQRDKIVAAIDGLGADVVSLEELENSVKFGKDRDFAIDALVDALNAEAGAGTWAYVPSPAAADLPPVEAQDVIRLGFIYRPDAVEPVGPSTVLTGSQAFSNARQPVAQAFTAVGARDGDAFLVIANHFKSKSGANDGTGQGGSNPDRVAQAEALTAFADDVSSDAGIAKVFLTGDFNAYTREDPINVIVDAGYTNLESTDPGEESYSFDGEVGSLDHVFANEAAAGDVTGVDIWTINAYESVYYEYSRFNYNVTDLYDTSPFRSSDHNPEIVGIDADLKTVPDLQVAVSPRPVRTGVRGTLAVEVETGPGDATGTVRIKVPGAKVRVVRLSDGQARIRLPRYRAPGVREYTVVYSGDADVEAARATGRFRVARR